MLKYVNKHIKRAKAVKKIAASVKKHKKEYGILLSKGLELIKSEHPSKNNITCGGDYGNSKNI